MKQAVRKPNKLESLKPTVDGSNYLRPQDKKWTPTQFEKTWIKVLYEDKSKGEMTLCSNWSRAHTSHSTSTLSLSKHSC